MDHVIIIGAGICGLTAATTLLNAGCQVTIVEARNRIGGRIHTIKDSFSRPIEAGAEFIHGNQPLTAQLLSEARGEQIRRMGAHFTLANGEIQKGDLLEDDWKAFYDELGKLTVDMTLADFLQAHFSEPVYAALRHGVTKFAEGFDIADPHQVSAIALREEWAHTDDYDQYHVHGGYEVIINYLAKKVSSAGGVIHLSVPVQEVQWRKGSVTVVTSSKTIAGDKVVITVPLGVLQRGLIKIDPALGGQQRALERIGYGGVIKFLFEFKERFWEMKGRQLGNASFIFSDAEIPTWWTQLPDTTPLITGWLGGPSTFLINHDVTALFNKAIRSLEYVFDIPAAEIRSQLHHWHVANWVNDPFSMGAYSYPTLDTKRAVSLLSQPASETIYFAGEAFYAGTSGGTVEAAISSGGAVAQQIVQGFKFT